MLRSSMVTIYMPLLNEGTNVWRPVSAKHLAGDVYIVRDNVPDGEEWMFATGSTVRCESMTLNAGTKVLAAVGIAD